MKIRCCVACGCQETSKIENKLRFWDYLNEEVQKSITSGSGLVIHFDGNLWAGPKIIPGDPRPQNCNGKLFEQFLDQNPHLTVVNSLSLCEGLITRKREKKWNCRTECTRLFRCLWPSTTLRHKNANWRRQKIHFNQLWASEEGV